MLPRSAEDLIRSVATYVSGSAKRSAQLVEIQEFFDGHKKKRNKIGNDSLNAVAIIRSSFQDKGINCTTFKVRKDHIDLHNSKNLY